MINKDQEQHQKTYYITDISGCYSYLVNELACDA